MSCHCVQCETNYYYYVKRTRRGKEEEEETKTKPNQKKQNKKNGKERLYRRAPAVCWLGKYCCWVEGQISVSSSVLFAKAKPSDTDKNKKRKR